MLEIEIFEKIISRHSALFGGVSAKDISVIEPSSTNLIFFFQHSNKRYALKVMPSGAGIEFSTMEEAGKHIAVPKPLSYGQIENEEYLLMQLAPGKNAHEVMPFANPQMKATFIDLSARILTKLHRSTLNIRENQRLKSDRLLTVGDVQNDLESLGVKDWKGISRLKAMEGDFPPGETCLIHGDYTPANMMVDKTGVTGVIDWENSFWGSPLYDVGFTLFVLKATGFDARLFLRSYAEEWTKPVKTDINLSVVNEPPKGLFDALPFYEALAAIEFYTFSLYAKQNPHITKLISQPSNSWQTKAISAAERFVAELSI